MRIFIYGAGKRGIGYGSLLKDKGITFEGYIDRNKETDLSDTVMSYDEFLEKYITPIILRTIPFHLKPDVPDVVI